MSYTIQSGKTVITAGSVVMEPDGILSYVKQCFIRTPFLFNNTPVVTATVFIGPGADSRYMGVAPLAIYGVEPSPATGETIFKISASNVETGENTDSQYLCNYCIMGELAEDLKSAL
ncbi:MAG: hypothetical protein QM768_20635 [Agriterribacter sp.]